MKHQHKTRTYGLVELISLGMLAATAGCSSDAYDTGDGQYSYLQADFGMAHVTAAKTVDHFLTDRGDTVWLSTPVTASWLPAKDTLCRALAYYDVKTKRLFSLSQVLVTRAADKAHMDNVPTDPLTLESTWCGGGYLNIGFAVKTGQTDVVDARQSIGLMVDSVETDGDSVRAVILRLLHEQNGVPQYYTVKSYLSMPLPSEWKHARLTVTANTYQGEQQLTAQ